MSIQGKAPAQFIFVKVDNVCRELVDAFVSLWPTLSWELIQNGLAGLPQDFIGELRLRKCSDALDLGSEFLVEDGHARPHPEIPREIKHLGCQVCNALLFLGFEVRKEGGGIPCHPSPALPSIRVGGVIIVRLTSLLIEQGPDGSLLDPPLQLFDRIALDLVPARDLAEHCSIVNGVDQVPRVVDRVQGHRGCSDATLPSEYPTWLDTLAAAACTGSSAR